MAKAVKIKAKRTARDYIEWLERRNRTPRTIRTYRGVLAKYVAWLKECGYSLEDVGPVEVEAFSERRQRMVSPHTRRREVTVVRQFHQWCNERGMPVQTVRTAAAPSIPTAVPKPVDDDVWRRLWGSELLAPDRLWLGLGYFCGLRRFEITNLAPYEVGPDMLVFLRKGGGHRPIEWRAVLGIVDDALPHLTMGRADEFATLLVDTAAQRRAIGAKWLWYDSEGDDDLDGNRLNKRLTRLLDERGLPPGCVTPHRLRHSCATNLLRAGMPLHKVQVVLSHSNVRTTMGYTVLAGDIARWANRRRENGDPDG